MRLTTGKTLSTLGLVLATMDEEPSEFYSDTTLVGELDNPAAKLTRSVSSVRT